VDDHRFNEIIDFAVAREQEAVAFYRDLQRMSRFDAVKELLEEFEAMEWHHIEILENLRHVNPNHISVPRIEDLMVGDHIEDSRPDPEMRYQDILLIAMKREQAAYNLYRELAAASTDEDTQRLLLKLASEEAKHRLMFERIYDQEITEENQGR